MKKLFSNVRKLSTSSTNSNFNLRRLSLNSSTSMPTIKVLRGGYNIDLQKVDSSFTKLHKAVYLNNVDRVKKYLAQKIGINSRDNYGRTALHLAAVNGNLQIIGMLLTASANVNVQDADGKSPLIKAIECGHAEVLPVLMEAGSDIDLADSEHGNTALHHSLINANLECSLYIIRNALVMNYNKRNQKKETFLHLCAKIPDLVTVIEELIANGIEIEAVDEQGRTAAQVASFHSNSEAFRIITMYATAQQQPVVMDDDASNDLDFTEDTVDSSHTENNRKHRNSIASSTALMTGDNGSLLGAASTSRGPSRSNSKLSSSSFGSNGSNYYRFSGLFEQTIVEENQNSISTNSASAATTTTSNSNSGHQNKSQINHSSHSNKLVSSNSDDQNENIYANFESPSTTLRKNKNPFKNNNNNDDESLSDEMSELDQMLNADIDSGFQLQVKPNSSDQQTMIFSNKADDSNWLGLIESDDVNGNDENEDNSILVVSIASETSGGEAKRKSLSPKLQLLKEKVVDIEVVDDIRSFNENNDEDDDDDDHSIYSNLIELQPQLATLVSNNNNNNNKTQATSLPSSFNHHNSHNNNNNNKTIQSNSISSAITTTTSSLPVAQLQEQESGSPKTKSSSPKPLVRQKSYAQVLASTPRKIANANANIQNQNNQNNGNIISSPQQRTSNNIVCSATNRSPSERRLQNRGQGRNGSFRSNNNNNNARAAFFSESQPGSSCSSPAKSANSYHHSHNHYPTSHNQSANRSIGNRNFSGSSSNNQTSLSPPQQHQQQFVTKVKSNRQYYYDNSSLSSSSTPSPANNQNHNNNRTKSQSIQSMPLPPLPIQQQQQQPATATSIPMLLSNSNRPHNTNDIYHHHSQQLRPLPQQPATNTNFSTKSCQTDSHPSNQHQSDLSQKYSNFMETLGRLLFSNSSLDDQNNNVERNAEGENLELFYLKRLTSLIRESNQAKIELELKQKEVTLLEQITEQMRKQIESEQEQRRELEWKFGQLMLVVRGGGGGGDSGNPMVVQYGPNDPVASSLKVNKQQSQPQSPESPDLGLSVLVDFMKEHYALKMKHYESALNEQLMENFALKKRCHFLNEQIRSWQQQPPLAPTSIDLTFVAGSTDELGNASNGNKQEISTGLLLSNRASFSQSINHNEPRTVHNNNNSNNDDEIQKRESMIQHFYDEIAGLKKLMSQLVTGLGGQGESGQSFSPPERFINNNIGALNASNGSKKAAVDVDEDHEAITSSCSSSTNTNDVRTPSPPPRRQVDDDNTNNTSNQTPQTADKPKKVCTLSRKKSFSMYDLSDVDFRYDFGTRNNNNGNDNGEYLGPNHHFHHNNNNNIMALLMDDLDKQSMGCQLSVDDSLLNNHRYYLSATHSTKLNSNNNLHRDYSGTFSYKSKYFQRKINDLKQKLAING